MVAGARRKEEPMRSTAVQYRGHRRNVTRFGKDAMGGLGGTKMALGGVSPRVAGTLRVNLCGVAESWGSLAQRDTMEIEI